MTSLTFCELYGASKQRELTLADEAEVVEKELQARLAAETATGNRALRTDSDFDADTSKAIFVPDVGGTGLMQAAERLKARDASKQRMIKLADEAEARRVEAQRRIDKCAELNNKLEGRLQEYGKPLANRLSQWDSQWTDLGEWEPVFGEVQGQHTHDTMCVARIPMAPIGVLSGARRTRP